MSQLALIIQDYSVSELNRLLNKGWVVDRVVPMTVVAQAVQGSWASIPSSHVPILVILETVEGK